MIIRKISKEVKNKFKINKKIGNKNQVKIEIKKKSILMS